MKSFDNYYQRSQVPDWSAYYIDYAKLKKQIRLFAKRRRKLKNSDLDWSTVLRNYDNTSQYNQENTTDNFECNDNANNNNDKSDNNGNNANHDSSNVAEESFGYATLSDDDSNNCGGIGGCGGGSGGGLGDFFICGVLTSETKEEKVSRMEHDEFKLLLQKELIKATRWFQLRWINDLMVNHNNTTNDDDDDNDSEKKEEKLILDLYGFLVVNICALRQLLLRYNAHVRTYDDAFGCTIFLSEWELYEQQQASAVSVTADTTPEIETGKAAEDGSSVSVGFSISSLVTVDVDGGGKITNHPSLVDFLEPLQDRMMTMSSYWMAATSVSGQEDFLGLTPQSALRRRMQTEGNDDEAMNSNDYYSDDVDGNTNDTEFRKHANELEMILDKISWKQQTKYLIKHHPLYTQSSSSTSSPSSTSSWWKWSASIYRTSSKRDRLLQTLRHCYAMGSEQMGINMEPKFLTNVRGFKKEMKSLAVWKESEQSPSEKLWDDDDDADGDSDTDGVMTGEMDPANVWPLILNLLSCYLHMMNTYIIEPSSAYYANALGSSDAYSGIMMGMAPWFTLISAVLYSIWTNTSYKNPTLCAGMLCIIGNMLYGVAYSYQSMELCLLGRAISGFGAPRIINRRYVADATPFKYRTMSSAAFALMTALGAASGPGFAILLDMIPAFTFTIPFLYSSSSYVEDTDDYNYDGRKLQQQEQQLLEQTFNGMTGPGFLMAVLWSFYTLLIVFTFREPNRSGLDELRQREQRDAATGATIAKARSSKIVDSYGGGGDTDDDSSSVGSSSYFSDAGSAAMTSKSSSNVSKHSPLYCIKNMTRATVLCMVLIFFKRVALESIVGSTSVITKNRYGWSIRNVGVLHLVNGLIVIPVSILAGWLSQFYEDRYLAMWFMGITSLGMLIMVDVTDLFGDINASDTYNEDLFLSVGPVRYISGSLIAFSGVEACESFVASLMSKCVPSALAVGTFNSGLLSTLVGTGGRAVGDAYITVMGLISIRNLLNLLLIPGMVLMLLSMLLLWRNYKIVAV